MLYYKIGGGEVLFFCAGMENSCLILSDAPRPSLAPVSFAAPSRVAAQHLHKFHIKFKKSLTLSRQLSALILEGDEE